MAFEIKLKPTWRQVRVASALLAVICLPWDLGSETVTFSTTYPSPVGIYARIITTGGNAAPMHTVLARDRGNVILVGPTNASGSVGIGTESPMSKLTVNGGGISVIGGGIQPGDDSSACAAGKAGTLRWHNVGGVMRMQVCRPPDWKEFGATYPAGTFAGLCGVYPVTGCYECQNGAAVTSCATGWSVVNIGPTLFCGNDSQSNNLFLPRGSCRCDQVDGCQ